MNLAWLYVAVVYGLAVLIARRARIDIPWWIAAAFYGLVLAFFFRPLTGNFVNVAPDVLNLVPPWSANAPAGFDKFQVSNYELQDIVFQFIPWTQQVHEQWRAGHVPLWNDFAACGMPLLANMQSGALSPLRLLTIPLPLPYSFAAEAAFKILVALTFTFLYCRRRGYDVLPSLIGAISFGIGTFMTTWLHFPHPNVAALLPAVLLLIDLLAEKRTPGRFVFAAFLGPALLAGGHPETAGHIVFFAVLYVAWLAFVERVTPVMTLAKTLFSVSAVSLLFSAPILLPFLETLPLSISYDHVETRSHAGGTAFSDGASLALLIHPRLYGERPGPLWGPAVTDNVTGFAGLLGIAAWLGLLVRAIRQRTFRSREVFFLIATALMFVWIADVPVISVPLRTLFSMALNSRLRLMFSFLLAVQVAALLHTTLRESAVPLLAGVAGAVAMLVFVLIRSNFPNDAARNFAWTATIPSLVSLGGALLLLNRRARPVVLPLLALIVFAELWQTSHGWHPIARRTVIYPRTPIVDDLIRRRGPEPYRIVGLGGTMFPNTHAPFHFEDVRVKDALASARYLRLLRSTRNWDAAAYYEKWADPDSPLLDDLNVKWLVTAPGAEVADRSRYRMVYDGFDGRVFENLRVKPRFHAPDAYISVAHPRSGSYDLHIDATKPARVISSVGFWPGWRVTYDGRLIPTRRVNDAFLGFDVPAGRGEIRLRYVPLSFWGGVVLAALTLLGLLITMRLRRVISATTADA
jgi:hypothetical protein